MVGEVNINVYSLSELDSGERGFDSLFTYLMV